MTQIEEKREKDSGKKNQDTLQDSIRRGTLE